jgi:hypothetical protein
MKNSWKWVILFGVVFMAVFIFAMLFSFGSGFGWMPMMANRGFSGFSGFNGFGVIGVIMMLFMMVIPLAFIGLTVLGVVYLVDRSRYVSRQTKLDVCRKCGEELQDDWKVCPQCGKKVK